MPYKKVCHIILVPQNDYCWDSRVTCGHFDNEGGYPRCTLGFYGLEYNNEDLVEKPPECKKLKTV